jgi:hypothetical protein
MFLSVNLIFNHRLTNNLELQALVFWTQIGLRVAHVALREASHTEIHA